jgi:hypothetical protein
MKNLIIKLQYSLFVIHLASMSMYIVLSFIKLISVHQRWNVLIFGLLIFQVFTAQFALALQILVGLHT